MCGICCVFLFCFLLLFFFFAHVSFRLTWLNINYGHFGYIILLQVVAGRLRRHRRRRSVSVKTIRVSVMTDETKKTTMTTTTDMLL